MNNLIRFFCVLQHFVCLLNLCFKLFCKISNFVFSQSQFFCYSFFIFFSKMPVHLSKILIFNFLPKILSVSQNENETEKETLVPRQKPQSVWQSDPEFFYTCGLIYFGMLFHPASLRAIKSFSLFHWDITNYQLCQEGHLQLLYLCRMLYIFSGVLFDNGFASLFMAFLCRVVCLRSWVLLVCQANSARAVAEGRTRIESYVFIPTVWKITTIYFSTLLLIAYLFLFLLGFVYEDHSTMHQIAILVATHTTTALLVVLSWFVMQHAFWCFRQRAIWRTTGFVCLFWGNLALFVAGLNAFSIHCPEFFFENFRVCQGMFLMGELVLIGSSVIYFPTSGARWHVGNELQIPQSPQKKLPKTAAAA